jgi:hypothetical protein
MHIILATNEFNGNRRPEFGIGNGRMIRIVPPLLQRKRGLRGEVLVS